MKETRSADGMSRYALYFTPPSGSALCRLGEAWFGAAGASALPDIHARLTAAPRRYGFHATLKAPFHLADGATLDDLSAALDDFAVRQPSISVGRLVLGSLDGFSALLPQNPPAALGDLAADCVRRFDRFRAPFERAEFERRAEGLPAGARAHLAGYGYPWVLDRFRFHMTLTDPVTDGEWRRLKPVLDEICRDALGEPLVIDAVTLLHEPSADAPFEIVGRFALSGAAAGM